MKRKKERSEEKKEGKERMKEGKNEKRKGGWPAMAGGHRRRPEMAGDGRNPVAQANYGGASVVKSEKLEFYKRSFGERTNSSSERARRGEEDGMVRGGQGGVGGGGDGGEGGGENGLSW